MRHPGPVRPMLDPRSTPPRITSPTVDFNLLLGLEADAVGGLGDVQLGQQVDAALHGREFDVQAGGDELDAGLVCAEPDGLLHADQQAPARADARMSATGERGVFVAGDVG